MGENLTKEKKSECEKRILITKFVGAAWEKVFLSGKYNPAAFFEKTGCLLTLDGSEDDKVRIEGCLEYKPPQAPKPDADDDGIEESKQSDPSVNEVFDTISEQSKEPLVESDVTDDEEVEVEENNNEPMSCDS